MTPQELLRELRDNILRDVSDAVDIPDPDDRGDLLWSDATLLNYINDGYFKFARETRMLEDDETAEVTQIVLEEGKARYAMDPRILAVRAANVGGVWLSRQRHRSMARADSGFARESATHVTTAGHVFGFSTDLRGGYLQVYDTPRAEDAGKILQLTVARMPLHKLSLEGEGSTEEMEFPEDYQLDILEWAAYRALKNHDTDGENIQKALQHRAAFFDAVNSARREASRVANAPMQFRPTGARW